MILLSLVFDSELQNCLTYSYDRHMEGGGVSFKDVQLFVTQYPRHMEGGGLIVLLDCPFYANLFSSYLCYFAVSARE